MASNHEFYSQCWSHELPAFVRVLKALPSEKLDYRPHEKNSCAGDIAWQLAQEMAQIKELVETGVINFSLPPRPTNGDEIVAAFEKAAEPTLTALKNVDDAKWASKGDFRMNGASVWSGTIQELSWGYLFDMIHHRGQLSTYIRPMGGKVPSIYGPSGDDQGS
jgi:hypothetical protein